MTGRGVAVHSGEVLGNELLNVFGRQVIWPDDYAHYTVS